MKRFWTRLLGAYNALFSRCYLVIAHNQRGKICAYSNVGLIEFTAMAEIAIQGIESLEIEDSILEQTKEILN